MSGIKCFHLRYYFLIYRILEEWIKKLVFLESRIGIESRFLARVGSGSGFFSVMKDPDLGNFNPDSLLNIQFLLLSFSFSLSLIFFTCHKIFVKNCKHNIPYLYLITLLCVIA